MGLWVTFARVFSKTLLDVFYKRIAHGVEELSMHSVHTNPFILSLIIGYPSHVFNAPGVLNDLSIVPLEHGISSTISRDVFTFGYIDSATCIT